MTDLTVEMGDLSTYAEKLSSLAGDSASTSVNLLLKMSAYAGVWGDDAPGSAFAADYQPAAVDVLGCTTQLLSQLTALGTSMRHTAQAYLASESGNAALASSQEV